MIRSEPQTCNACKSFAQPLHDRIYHTHHTDHSYHTYQIAQTDQSYIPTMPCPDHLAKAVLRLRYTARHA